MENPLLHSRTFIHADWLLTTDASQELYHRHASKCPIIDYHNHLPPAQIASNYQFSDLFEIWLAGDHYKWRAMRSNGFAERFCTGDASGREKFDAFVATVPYTLRNPLYHWSHLELARHFDLDVMISPETGNQIWEACNAKLPSLRVNNLLEMFDVAVLGTTDDPADSLATHEKIASSGIRTRVYPTFRPDKAFSVSTPDAFNPWLERLSSAAGMVVTTFDDLVEALKKRHDDFHALGGRLSDHGMKTCYYAPCSHNEAVLIFKKARSGVAATADEQAQFATYLMLEFGRWDAVKGWTKQLHIGAMRSVNSRNAAALGADIGCDSIGDFSQARTLGSYLDALDREGMLPKVIIYNLNPADNYVIGTMIGNFQDGSVAGKIQFGSGWWFLDQKEAMEWQMNALSNLGLLRRFVGMLTDSRSFLSFPRHEYFRRILCDLLGRDMERGELPQDMELVGSMVREICFENARDYFGFEIDPGFTAVAK
jgi:glucuronate isomerase